ncbi:MAG: glycosyl transferase group 1, partial [Sediminibacterium sp.]|nr:glycosyl transferase group 1 [Sediminibacterium sp.]
KEYFEDDACYCDPGSPASILAAVKKAAGAPLTASLREKIMTRYTWQEATARTIEAYTAATGCS